MKLRQYPFLFVFLIPFSVHAQSSAQLNAAEIKQGLETLNTSGSVLYIAAHPDDENTRLLAYLAREKKVRTGYLSLTRGDGGQNLIGTEQAELLGLIRTQELLAARRTDGAEQFFTRANDFGFSKNPEESFKIWDKAKILADVVWVIRKFQPDVIITRFPEDSRAGHGHHSGSAILAREAFTAAADPKQFPEQLKYVKPWQARRIVWNTFNFGGNNTTAEDQIKLDVGLYNALLGKSYGEIAADSRSNHKSQGFGSAKQRGSALEYFSPVGGVAAKDDLFEGVDFSLGKIPGSAGIQKLLNEINREYEVSNPSKSVAKLLTLRLMVKDVPFKHELLDELILAAAGIWIERGAVQPAYALNDPIQLKLQAIARVGTGFTLPISITEAGSTEQIKLAPNQFVSVDRAVNSNGLGLTQPYWLEKRHLLGAFTVDDPLLIGLPENAAVGAADISIKIGDQTIIRKYPMVYKSTDPVRAEVYQPVVIAPPVTATLAEKAFVFNGNEPRTVTVQLNSFSSQVSGKLVPHVPEGWKVTPEEIDFNFKDRGDQQLAVFTVRPGTASGGTLSVDVVVGGKTYQQGLKIVDYNHIPVQTLFPFAEAKVEKVDLKFTGKRIGYINGAGDLIPESLKQIGYEVVVLTPKQVSDNDLSGFDAIITGVRFYNINEQLNVIQPRLMKYVEDGGVLLVQYNVNSPLKINEIGPYPFRLTRDRVTEEDAAIDFLAPSNPLLNYPNKITASDFEGWVQERGLYFSTELDSHYTAVLGMHDQGESQKDGALITTNYGKGRFVYTGLSFFRQLPAGVPGAYRLFVNLISKPKGR